jgi:GNAT superfamily N-acetyltransferase
LSHTLLFQAANAEEIETLLAMMRELYSHDSHPFSVERARCATLALLATPIFGNIWLLKMAEEVVGYMVLTFGFSLEFGGRDALLDELFITETYRGSGLGKQALHFVFEHCRKAGIRALHLEVLTGNDTAEAIYARAGFQKDHRRLMTKWLS